MVSNAAMQQALDAAIAPLYLTVASRVIRPSTGGDCGQEATFSSPAAAEGLIERECGYKEVDGVGVMTTNLRCPEGYAVFQGSCGNIKAALNNFPVNNFQRLSSCQVTAPVGAGFQPIHSVGCTRVVSSP